MLDSPILLKKGLLIQRGEISNEIWNLISKMFLEIDFNIALLR